MICRNCCVLLFPGFVHRIAFSQCLCERTTHSTHTHTHTHLTIISVLKQCRNRETVYGEHEIERWRRRWKKSNIYKYTCTSTSNLIYRTRIARFLLLFHFSELFSFSLSFVFFSFLFVSILHGLFNTILCIFSLFHFLSLTWKHKWLFSCCIAFLLKIVSEMFKCPFSTFIQSSKQTKWLAKRKEPLNGIICMYNTTHTSIYITFIFRYHRSIGIEIFSVLYLHMGVCVCVCADQAK